ncbi:uncharacterized protein PV09_05143 [Verruconis gallopava]|uniref:ABC transporter domain-containing protein n=1 Tax=Verruconis gallopava TaxID=253628 RepID=A0A0D2AXC9_9PEZI|nr:uncharacterized protein PV09_05143 [Verruconis gallopava]KIW03844.1 hypothetical protein PV09_05143 [Verruconis gallopava]
MEKAPDIGVPEKEEVESPPLSSPDSPRDDEDGHWGERGYHGAESREKAMEDFAELRNTLSALSRTRSGREMKSSSRRSASLPRREGSRLRQQLHRFSSARHEVSRDTESTLDEDDFEKQDEKEDDFELSEFMREGHFEKQVDGRSTKRIGVTWKNLTVKGAGTTSKTTKTLPDAILGTFGPDLYRIITRFIPRLKLQRHTQLRTLIHDFTGIVRPGEMMLVLGRPGSGCSTFLKCIANYREGYAEVSGEVSYGGIDAKEQKKHFRGEVSYNPETDLHFATLTVWQTLKFSLMNKTRRREKGEIPIIVEAFLKIFGITHTRDTLVGDEYVRGVSGGERKRVSIAETLSTKSTVTCWDNSTRGLDSSTALDYAKSLRIMTDISARSTLVTLYQAGEGIYELMDKVMVIDSGRCIFLGRASEAKKYFIDLGYHCPERQTTPDFLTSVTDPSERKFREGFENSAPRGPVELEKAFRDSEYFQKVLADIEDYCRSQKESDFADARQFAQTARELKSKTVTKKSVYTVSFIRQVYACTLREIWLIWGDKPTLYTKFFIVIANALIVGSLFYGEALNTSGAFSRGGAVFFSIVFLGWLQLSELMKAVSGRDVVARHREYAFYRPSAVSVARAVVDFPFLLIQVIPFAIIMYFLTQLDVSAGKFWIYFLFVYTMTIVLTAMYRMFAALSPTVDDAVRFAGTALNLLVIYVGYVIPKPQLTGDYIWFGWLYYVNPISYVFEAVLTNEFSDRTMECAPQNLVPQGPGVNPEFQGCTLTGSPPNSHNVSGASYVGTTYSYTRAHLWRNFGVAVAFGILYLLVTVVSVEMISFNDGGAGALVFKNTWFWKKKETAVTVNDEEKAIPDGASVDSRADQEHENGGQNEREALSSLAKSESIFTWRNVEYTVPFRGGQKKLLNGVSGYAKPGKMVALMGASGAGKTTLLNTLSQRQTVGVVSGDMLVDGEKLGPDFQRGTGFCEQMDLHDGTATIREALEFSAILRQEREVPRAEKIAYVDTIIDLLELNNVQDALISSLDVEQKKRLTIGVELAAKPSLLLFLDEPTSGLDSNSAYSIVRFLKKLAAAGQAIVCTIHQPSSVLIQQFDMILALNPGGNTIYFGPVGENGKNVIDYFAQRGVQCPPNKNVAEFILETAAKGTKGKNGRRINWNEEWKNSDNAKEVLAEIDRVCQTRSGQNRDKGDAKLMREFAAPIWLQTTMLTKRVFTQYWRDPSYLYGKLFVSVIIGIFNGFTFWKLGDSIQDMQNRMFTIFLVVVFPPTFVNAVVPKFYQNMALWKARELPSRIYGWIPFCTAMIVAEIPIAILSGTIYWALWYWPTGLPTNGFASGYTYLMVVLFFIFQSSWGQWICAFAPSFTVISNVLPFFFVMFGLFNGIVRPYSDLPTFWKYWMYWVNPSTYYMGGVLAATLHNQSIKCTTAETAQFNVPAGETCASYAGAFARSAGGYLLNPDATTGCQYCPYSIGDQYLTTLNIRYSDVWRNFGIFLAFCISNWALVYFFIWSVRIKGWSFGFGSLSGMAGKAVLKAKSLFSPRKKADGQE